MNGRAAVVVPDNVLFEGGAGETVRRQLLQRMRCPHAAAAADRRVLRAGRQGERPLLRPQARPRQSLDGEALDLRPADEHALHSEDEPAASAQTSTSSSSASTRPTVTSGSHLVRGEPDGRWRAYDYDELLARDKASLDIFWLRDESLEDTANLPDPDVIAAEIADDLRTALEEFEAIQGDLGAKAQD